MKITEISDLHRSVHLPDKYLKRYRNGLESMKRVRNT